MTVNAPSWAEPQQEGGYMVDVPKLLFAITLRELIIVDILHIETKEGRQLKREENIEIWKAMVQNLRQIDKTTCVRAAYHLYFNPRGSTRKDYPERWKAAWDLVNQLFSVDLETIWDDGIEWSTEIATDSAKEDSQ